MTYITVAEQTQTEIIIQKSRFIAHIFPTPDEHTAKTHIEETSKTYWDATHNCYAYVIGEDKHLQKSNDDGEPSGTAGIPILETIKKNGLTDTLIIVTRYFGGIKLGAGGLIRAYSQSANAAIREARLIQKLLHRQFTLNVDYGTWAKIESRISQSAHIIDRTFTDSVTVTLSVPDEQSDELTDLVRELTNGTGELRKLEQKHVSVPYTLDN